jgi:hypothetical protein
MKIRSFFLATAIVSAATGFAFAQTSPAANPETGNVQPGANANTKAVPAGQAMQPTGTKKPAAQTTGANTKETNEKAASPASSGSGIKQEK